jgi:CBS domain-containing protein
VGAVISALREFGVSHMPVMDNGKLVGIISIHDIIENTLMPRKHKP